MTSNSEIAHRYAVEDWQKEYVRKITLYLQANLEFCGLDRSNNPESDANVTLLDYACGTGILSGALGPYVNSIQGLDLSPKMLQQYQDLAATSPISSIRKAKAQVGNLMEEPQPPASLNGPEYRDFSLIGVCAAFHHFEKLQLSIDRLAERLRPGGALLIIDLVDDSVVSVAPSRRAPFVAN